METASQAFTKRHGNVEVLQRSMSGIVQIRTDKGHEFWIPGGDVQHRETPEEKASRLLISRAQRNQSRLKMCSTLQFLAFVVEHCDYIRASVKAGQEAQFEANWLVQTGEICVDKYDVEPNENRWGLSTTVHFPTPPAGMVFGDVNVITNPITEGYSFVCCNDFFWQVVAEVKQIGAIRRD